MTLKNCVLFRWLLVPALLIAAVTILPAQVNQGPTTIRTNEHHDSSPPLRELIKKARPSRPAPQEEEEVEPMKRIPLPPGMVSVGEDPVRQHLAGLSKTGAAVGNNFEGLGQGQYGFTVPTSPADPDGAVGATQYVQWVNKSFAVFDKTSGTLIAGPVAGNTLWTGFGGGCESNNDGDPVVLYDKLANQWVMSQFSVSTTPYLQCIAVSQTSDATGPWYRYSFQYSNFDDYPKMGVWSDGYYVTFDMFRGGVTFIGSDACAYDRSQMLLGLPATQVCFQQGASVGGLLPADIDGTTPPPAGSPNYMMNYGANSLNLYQFSVDFVTPSNSTFTGPTVINVASFSPLCGAGVCVPEPGTTNTLDSMADRLMYRLAYRNFGDHESIVANHSVVAGSSGGVRWYEIQNPGGTPSVAQQGTYAPDSNYRWMGSIAMDQSGDLAIGYSESSSTVYPSVAFAGRLATDPAGILQAETNIVSGTGSQINGLYRWGDYSALTVDPVDDCTFWYTQEYFKTNGSPWNTRIASFKFPSCGSDVTLTPASLNFGSQGMGSTSQPQTLTLTNAQTTDLTALTINASGDYGFTTTCGTVLPAGTSCTINVTFSPTLTGTRVGILQVTDNAGTQESTLTGIGVSQVSLNPSSLNFGRQPINTASAALSLTLANGQNTDVSNVSVVISGTGQADYAQSSNCGSVLPANTSCTIKVIFTPSAYGTRNAVLTANFSTGSLSSSLTGVGADVTPPVTQVSTPVNGAKVSGTTTVTATASDPGGMSAVYLYIDGAFAALASGSSVTYSWNTVGVSNGTHTIYSKAYDTSGNCGTSPTITVTVNNTVTQLIKNGGFETGNLSSWSAAGVDLPTVVTTKPHVGVYSAQLGTATLPEPLGDSSIYQTITIPSTATTASLTYYYWGSSSDTVLNDWQEAQVQDTTGKKLAQIMKVCSNTRTWTLVTYNLIAYKGKTIRLYFNAHEDGGGDSTYMYLDDVSVAVK